MTAITGIWKNGHIELKEAADWPDGTEVVVEPVRTLCSPGMTEGEQADDPESIARWLAEFDAIPPLRMTPEEEAEWQAARRAQKAYELAKWEERSKQTEGLFP